jgi:hypothetical protein
MTNWKKTFIAALGATPMLCWAGVFNDLDRLEGKVVLYAGEFESITCPIDGKYDCTTWPMTMLKTRKGPEICLGTDKYVRCGYKCSGLIAVGEDKVPKAYVFSPMSSDATEIPVEKYRCPAPF